MKRYPSQLTNQNFIQFLAEKALMSISGEPIYAFDATAGNGHDTLWLAQLVGNAGRVYAVDIQEQALQTTRQRLQEAQCEKQVSLFLTGHEKLAYILPEEVKKKLAIAVYNLGYLPGSNKTVMTLPESTITSLQECLQWLRPGGIVMITLYPGHSGGDREAEMVENWVKKLDSRYWQVIRFQSLNRQTPAPRVIAIEATSSFSSQNNA